MISQHKFFWKTLRPPAQQTSTLPTVLTGWQETYLDSRGAQNLYPNLLQFLLIFEQVPWIHNKQFVLYPIKASQGPTQPIIEPGHRGLRRRSRSRGPSLDRYTAYCTLFIQPHACGLPSCSLSSPLHVISVFHINPIE